MENLADFEYQLRAQQEYSGEGESASGKEGYTYTDPSDGTEYEWDPQRKGWFPKIDDDFLAAYQASYGVDPPSADTTTTTTAGSDATSSDGKPGTKEQSSSSDGGDKDGPSQPEGGSGEKEGEGEKTAGDEEGDPKGTLGKRKAHQSEGWFDIDDDHNHNVYVSGLPLDMTVEEFVDLMSKYGIVMEDENGDPKVKLYTDANGMLKGDALCCYLKIESVQLALQIMDGSTIRDHTITVEKAKFNMKGDYNPALKKKKKNKKKKKGGQERLLDWRERAEGPKRSKYDKIVIFKNLFHPKEFEEDPMLINEIRDDLRAECEKFGPVKKILIFDRHPEGICSLAFKELEAADQCVVRMNGRWYGGKQLSVSCWDGVTNYQVEETDKEREQRLQKWEEFLEDGTREDQPKT